MPTGAQLFVRTLEALGIRTIFTLVGDHLNEVLVEAGRAGFQIIDMRHESGVTHAADAYARLTRRPAVSLVTGGPGHTNSLTGIATAYLVGSPLIAVSGAPKNTLVEREAFQVIRQVEMAKPVVKWAAEPVDVSQIPFLLVRAYVEAMSGRPGPVHLSIPVNLFEGTVSHDVPIPAVNLPSTRIQPDRRDVEKTVALIRQATRPVAIAGAGAWWSDAGRELQEFIERTQIPLYTVSMGRGVVSDEHPLCMGYADPALNRAVCKVFKQADLVLVFGKRIDFRIANGGPRLFSPEAKFVQVEIYPQELGRNRALEVGIWADLKTTLQSLLEALGNQNFERQDWLAQVRTARQEWESQMAELARDSSEPLHPMAFFAELKKVLPKDALYSWDGGDFVHWGRIALPATIPGGWLRLGPLGTIGSGLPNAVAMQLLNPGKPVILPVGDGALGFYIAELDTLVRHNLPVIVIVGNDAGWGMEREFQRAGYQIEKTVACELVRSRYELVMEGFGGRGEAITSLSQVRPAMERALSSGKPYLLNVHIRGARSPFTQWQIEGKAQK